MSTRESLPRPRSSGAARPFMRPKLLMWRLPARRGSTPPPQRRGPGAPLLAGRRCMAARNAVLRRMAAHGACGGRRSGAPGARQRRCTKRHAAQLFPTTFRLGCADSATIRRARATPRSHGGISCEGAFRADLLSNRRAVRRPARLHPGELARAFYVTAAPRSQAPAFLLTALSHPASDSPSRFRRVCSCTKNAFCFPLRNSAVHPARGRALRRCVHHIASLLEAALRHAKWCYYALPYTRPGATLALAKLLPRQI